MNNINEFSSFLKTNGKSKNTLKGYILDMNQYFKWFEESFDQECKALYRQNVLDYVNYLKNVKLNNAKTINHKLSSLRSYNNFLISSGIQNDIVIVKTDMLKIQPEYTSPTHITELEVKQFMQKVLESKNMRNYAIVTLLAYTGMRISEALSILLDDLNLQTGECIVRNGKGNKQRTTIMNTKVINAIRDYLKYRDQYSSSETSGFLFISRTNGNLNRTVVNRIFQRHSVKITPHQLRHFFCTNAIEKGLSIHEVANQVGHSNINTTMLYTNPDKAKLKSKMELL
jgi:integrase/recombinase XerD